METPKMHVKCSVDNCHYNERRYCQAEALEVNAMGDGIANTSEGTVCTTFKNRD